MNGVRTYPEMNKTIKDLLRDSEEPMMQYALARIEELETAVLDAEAQHRTEKCEAAGNDCKEHGELEAYKATGVTPEEIVGFLLDMQAECIKCSKSGTEPVFDAKPGDHGCPFKSCRYNKWRAKWYKEEKPDA